MPTFKQLIRNKKVAEHPLLRGYHNLPKVRDNINKHAQELQEGLTDLLSQGYNLEDKPKNLNEMVREASMIVQDVFSQFDIPVIPKFFYETSRDIKHARNDETRVVEGSLFFGAEFRSILGVRKRATVPVAISAGELVPPSVMEMDGRIYVIAQSSIDEILERNTTYSTPPLRESYQTPPLNRFEREMAVDMKVSQGPQPRKNPGSYYMNQRNVEARRKVAIGGTPRMWAQVVEAMEKAEKDGTDTFPRSWIHVLRNYVLDFVSTASKDAWEPHLINAGFCFNPYGKATNRGRHKKGRKVVGGYEPEIQWLIEEGATGRFGIKDDTDLVAAFEALSAEFGGVFWFLDDNDTCYAIFRDPERGYKVVSSPYIILFDNEEENREYVPDDVNVEYTTDGKVTDTYGYEVQIPDEILESVGQFELKLSRNSQAIQGDFEKEVEMEVDQDGIEQLLDEEPEAPSGHGPKGPKMYPETKTPIESGDGVKVKKGPGGQGFQGTIVEVDEDGDYLIIKSKGMEYRVTVEDIEPVPSTFKKMYM